MRHKHHSRYLGETNLPQAVSHAAAGYASAQAGLSDREAHQRFVKFGPNEPTSSPKLSALAEFFLRFKNPLIIILILAAVLAVFFGDDYSAAIIIIIVLASVSLDFVNTVKSERAAEALRARVATTATISRGGRPCEISLREIVPGDLVLLEPGDMVPADGVVAVGKDFFINESVLNGESFPLEKRGGDKLLMGSSIVTGTGAMTVTATGPNTSFNQLAKSLVKAEEPTDFDISMRRFSSLIMRITLVLIVFTFLVNVLLRHSVLDSFLFAMALAVGLTPELLPMIIALNLSKGSLRLAHHGIIVKKLSALQSLGSMDVLCTDKTGTLTEDKISLVKYVDADGRESENVLLHAYLSSIFETGFTNPLDEAVKAYRIIDASAYRKIDEIPFDFSRRRSSVVVENKDGQTLITKGAPEELFTQVSLYGPQKEPFEEARRKQIYALYHSLSESGYRVLGVAVKKIHQTQAVYSKTEENNLTFLGFIAFLDPPKKLVDKTLALLAHYGLTIKIITGDNELVTQRIATDLNLNIQGVLTGQQLAELDDDELRLVVERTNIFARITPDQKERLIKIIRSNGHVVGYLGDGINDAAPLKAADVGISVSNAVDVAKESADLVLSNKSLEVLVEGVVEGRNTFANTLKYLMMSLSSNFGNTFSVAAASFLLPWLPMLPAQILLNNLIYDTSQLSIPFDNVDHNDLSKPKKLGIKFIKSFMFTFGPVSSFFDLLTFAVLYYGFHLTEAAFQTGWFLESLATQIFVIYLVRTKRLPFLQSRPSTVVVISTLSALAVGLGIVFSPWAYLFKFSAPPALAIVAICLIVFAYLISVEIVKRWLYTRANFSLAD